MKESLWYICHTDCLKTRDCDWGDKKMPWAWQQVNQKSCPELFLPYKQTSARLVTWEQCELQEEQAAAVLVLSNSLAEGRNSSRLVYSLISFVIHCNSHCNRKQFMTITKRSWFSIFEKREWKWKARSWNVQVEWAHTIYHLYCEFTHAKHNHLWRAQPMRNTIHQRSRLQDNTVCLGESGFFLD